jgi:ADP-ribose pyrophosphatase YjhB (NUDIX family)
MEEKGDNKERNFPATVVFPVNNETEEVLLARKREKIGAGRFNGPGGEVECCDPTIEFRATLEMWQEIRIVCMDENLQKVAICHFTNIKEDGSIFVIDVHMFLVEYSLCTGIPGFSKEMEEPMWFHKRNLPLSQMMAADRYWLSEVFAGKKIEVWATTRNHQSELVGDVKIVEVDSFE